MRISDWSSDVCSSDLDIDDRAADAHAERAEQKQAAPSAKQRRAVPDEARRRERQQDEDRDDPAPERQPDRRHDADRERTRGEQGKRVEGRVELGGRRMSKKKKQKTEDTTRQTK